MTENIPSEPDWVDTYEGKRVQLEKRLPAGILISVIPLLVYPLLALGSSVLLGLGVFNLSLTSNQYFTMTFKHFPLAVWSGLLTISASAQMVPPATDSLSTDTIKKKYVSEEIVISATRANDMTPVTQYNLNQTQIKEKYYGADIPTFLNSTPSVNSYSDAGNGIGYSYISLRGLEPKRINFSINGIPINDPETQGFYTNNFADILSSAKSVQVQRGVGTSANGTAALAGSISVITKDLSLKPEASITAGYGSFNSRRITGEVQTGLIANKFAFYGRLSEIASDGYRYNSGAQIRTFFVSAGYFGKKSLLKFNAFGGTANSKLAYSGIDKATMDLDRRTNPLTVAETDQFQQYFYQLQYTYEFNQHLNLSAQAYYVKGLAPAFNVLFPASWGYSYSNFNLPNAVVGTETVTGTNVLTNYRLNQDYLGGMAFLNYKKNRLGVNLGIHASRFSSDHFMEIPWAQVLPDGTNPNHQVYFNTGYKNELSAFVKVNYQVTAKFNVFADLQVRNATFTYKNDIKPILNDTFRVDNMSWVFLNPKVGARYAVSSKNSFYLTAGLTSREPTRSDYFLDDRATRDVKQSDVKPESVFNIELGNETRTENIFLKVNGYYMNFTNQLAPTGEVNLYGSSITSNVPSSFRSGIELDGNFKITKWLSLPHTSAFSYNRIQSYKKFYDKSGYSDTSITYTNVNPAMTPSVIINQGVQIDLTSWITFGVNARFVSKQYLDNSQDENLTIPDFWFADFKASIRLGQFVKVGDPLLSLQWNNIFNAKYTPYGTVSGNGISSDANGNIVRGTTAYYFPAASSNVMVTLSLRF